MNSRNKTLIIGGLVGSVLGVLAAWLYVKTSGEEEEAPQAIQTGKMVKLGLSIMEILRQVTALAEGEKEGRKRGWRRNK
jgi:gas vesicle protein